MAMSEAVAACNRARLWGRGARGGRGAGRQAARSSDFAIGEFRLVRRLMAVHGRYSGVRTTDLIKYSFYKNVCFCMPQILFTFFNLYSSSSVYNSWVILAYNVLFTGLPPLILAVFEKDVSESVLDLYPELYCTPGRRRPLTAASLVYWEAHAVWQGLAVALGVLYATQVPPSTPRGFPAPPGHEPPSPPLRVPVPRPSPQQYLDRRRVRGRQPARCDGARRSRRARAGKAG